MTLKYIAVNIIPENATGHRFYFSNQLPGLNLLIKTGDSYVNTVKTAIKYLLYHNEGKETKILALPQLGRYKLRLLVLML